MSCTASRRQQTQSRPCQPDLTQAEQLPALCTHHPPFTISWLSSRMCPHKSRPQPCLLGQLPLGMHTYMQRKMMAAMQPHLALLPLLCPDLPCRTLKGIQQPAVLRNSHPLSEAFRLLTQESRPPCQAPVKQNTEILSLGRRKVSLLSSLVQPMHQCSQTPCQLGASAPWDPLLQLLG